MRSLARARPLTGGTALWIVMAVEIVTFGLFLLTFAAGFRAEPDVFRASQSLLHPASGVRGTALLLTSSWLVYQAVLDNQAGRARATAAWLGAAAVVGLGFGLNKGLEYASPALAGVTLSTNPFWFHYLFLTGLHLLHVAGGVVALGWIARDVLRGEVGPAEPLAVEAVAAYWHLVDVIWLLLFPLLYLMHP